MRPLLTRQCRRPPGPRSGQFRKIVRSHLFLRPAWRTPIFQHGPPRRCDRTAQWPFLFGKAGATGRPYCRTTASLITISSSNSTAHFENLAEILLVFIEEFVHVAVADQNDFYVDIDWFRVSTPKCQTGKKHLQRLNFEARVVQTCVLSVRQTPASVIASSAYMTRKSNRRRRRMEPARRFHEIRISSRQRES